MSVVKKPEMRERGKTFLGGADVVIITEI